MAELTVTDIKVFNGTNWVTGFNTYDGANWQNINDGKVNIRGGDGNWYKKNSIVATISPTTNGFTSGKYHLDNSKQDWSVLIAETSCGYNPDFSTHAYYGAGWYSLLRGLLRFDFSSVTPFSFNNVTLKLYINPDALSYSHFYEESSVYLFNNDNIPLTTDFSNFGTRYSEIAGCSYISPEMTINFNAAGITALQNAVNSQSIITFMIRPKEDTENIPPTVSNVVVEMDYSASELIFLK